MVLSPWWVQTRGMNQRSTASLGSRVRRCSQTDFQKFEGWVSGGAVGLGIGIGWGLLTSYSQGDLEEGNIFSFNYFYVLMILNLFKAFLIKGLL